MHRLVPNCRPGFKRAATVMAVFAFSFFSSTQRSHTTRESRGGIRRAMKAQLKADSLVSRCRQRIVHHALWLRLAKRIGALIRPLTPALSVLRYWEYWPSGRSAGRRFFSGQHDRSDGSLRRRWSDFKAHRLQRFTYCGSIVGHSDLASRSPVPGSGLRRGESPAGLGKCRR
jgi:hypothetical protein